jgi:hypothetical protein
MRTLGLISGFGSGRCLPIVISMDLEDFNGLHDAQLDRIFIEWEAARVAFEFTYDLAAAAQLPLAGTPWPPDGRREGATQVRLVAHEFADLHVSRREPWGPSHWVNSVRRIASASGGLLVEVEMQSGDVIQVECARLEVESG